MKHVHLYWKRAVASSIGLAVVMLMSVIQAPAVESHGEMTSKQVKSLVATAKTPSDHMKLAHHYTAMAAKHEEEARDHDELAAEYSRSPQFGASKHPMAQNSAEHCKFMADHCRNAAKEMRAMAAMHEEMSKGHGN